MQIFQDARPVSNSTKMQSRLPQFSAFYFIQFQQGEFCVLFFVKSSFSIFYLSVYSATWLRLQTSCHGGNSCYNSTILLIAIFCSRKRKITCFIQSTRYTGMIRPWITFYDWRKTRNSGDLRDDNPVTIAGSGNIFEGHLSQEVVLGRDKFDSFSARQSFSQWMVLKCITIHFWACGIKPVFV